MTVSTDPTVTPEELEDAAVTTPAAGSGALVEEDLLVEDVSIDGMCGVY